MKSILIIILLLSPIITFSYGWHTVTVDNSEEAGYEASIALDSNNYPHIAYYDSYNYWLKYAYYDGKKWNIDNIDCLDVWGGISLALDSNNHPHISYVGRWNDDLRYAYFDGNKWNIEAIDRDSKVGVFTSIAVDSKDRPHISYYEIYTDDLKYAYYDGIKWNIEDVDCIGDVGCPNSIAIDSKDHIHISYCDRTNKNLKYAFFDGTSWNLELVYNKGNIASGCSIDVDSKDRPCISFDINIYEERFAQLIFTYKSNNKWYFNIADENYFGFSVSSMKIDSRDYPHIFYCYTYFPDNFYSKYTYFNGNTWHYKSFEDEEGFGTLTLDSNDYPHIAYYLDPNLKYKWYDGPYPGITLTSFSAKPNNVAITLNWSVSTDEQISGFNLYRRVATPHTNSNTVRENSYSPTCSPAPVGEIAQSPPNPDNDYVWTKVNTSLITGTNPYSYTDRDIMPDTNYEYKLEAVVSDKNETLGTTECTSGKGTPGSFDIVRIYPTPAYDRISIDVIIPEQSDIDIAIYDISGRRVSTIASGQYNEGEYTLSSYITGLTNGVYIVRMTANGFSSSKNFVVAK